MSTSTDADVHQQVLSLLQGIPMLERLSPDELQRIYGICRFKKYGPDDEICQFGEPSDSLFILLDGTLMARTATGVDIAQISPVGVVGEMGLIMDQPRSATVGVVTEAMGFEITKRDLISLFLADSAVCRKVLLNLVKILSNKLYATNAEIQKLREDQSQPASAFDQSDNIFLY